MKVLSATGTGWKTPPCSTSCGTLGAPDLDHDGRNELALRLWNGASTIGVGLYRVNRKAMVRLRERGSARPLELTDAGSVCCWSDVRCWGKDRLAQINGSYLSLWRVTWSMTVYAFDGRELRRLRTVSHPSVRLRRNQGLQLPGRPCWPG